MKCGRASPYGEYFCQLDKGHEGPCFDDMHHFIKTIDALGRDFIFDINAEFNTSIPVTEKTTKAMRAIIGENEDAIMEGGDYGYCPDCDERRGEPMHNEGYD